MLLCFTETRLARAHRRLGLECCTIFGTKLLDWSEKVWITRKKEGECRPTRSYTKAVSIDTRGSFFQFISIDFTVFLPFPSPDFIGFSWLPLRKKQNRNHRNQNRFVTCYSSQFVFSDSASTFCSSAYISLFRKRLVFSQYSGLLL